MAKRKYGPDRMKYPRDAQVNIRLTRPDMTLVQKYSDRVGRPMGAIARDALLAALAADEQRNKTGGA